MASAGTISTIATAASLTAGVASVGAQLTQPKPIARGSPAQLVIDVEPPRPYIVGRVMTGGVLRHDVAYGETLKKVPNPYRWQVRVLSGAGPIQDIVSEHFDFAAISSFYSGFFSSVQSLGERPQTAALVPPYGAAPGWGSTSKLSGCAHVGLNFKYDRDGKVFASGVPTYTALCDGEKSYDPRLDSTFPGGSGPCRLGNESTYVFSGGNPAIEAAMYAYGRFQDGKRIFGLGQPADTIDWAAVVDWANDCDANGWTVNIILQEGGAGANLREQRVRNLDDLCAAGGGRWYQAGGMLSFDWHRPRLSLATLTDDDILEAGGGTDAVPTVSERMNGVRPQYVSPAHNWQQITAAEIVGSTYRTEDGQPLTQVYPLNGVTNPEQAGELASYAMADSRELGPMDIQAKAAWRFYRPGDCITVDSSLVAYDGLAVINQRGLSPETLAVGLSLKSETPGKHVFALGKVAVPPATPTLGQTGEERDLVASGAITPRASDVEFDDDQTVEDLKPAEPGATEGAVVPTPGSGASGNVKDEAGNLYDPGELLNSSLELTPAGVLQFRPLPGVEPVARGQITLPDLGAASEFALRKAEDDVDALATALSTALDEASRTRETFTDAGFYTDPATGEVRIHAVEQSTERLNTVDLRLDAAEASINLRATTSYVDQAITEAVLDPSQIADLDTVFVRLTAAELDIDGLEATVTTLATVTELTALTGRVTTAETELDALEGTVSTKVDTTTFDALDTRVTTAESTLTALGDTAQIVNAVTSIRLVEREVDANAEGALAALVQDDRNQRDQVAAVASVRQELRTEITDGLTAEATARLALQVQVDDNAASLATESLTRASEDAALASQITALEASTSTDVAALEASITAEETARTSADSALAADITSLEAGLATETSQRTAAVTAANQARADGDATIAASVTSLTTTVNGQTATLATYGESIDGLEARYGVRLDVNGRITGFQQNNDGSQGGFTVVADNFEVIDPDLGPGGTPVTVFQILNGVISGAALNFDDVIGSNRPEDGADVTATAQRSIVPEYPVIEIKEGEAGHTGNRTVTHTAKRGTTTLTGGTWTLTGTNVGTGSATINSSTGTVTLSGIVASGAYTVRYTHTDGVPTPDFPVNVTYVPPPPAGTVSQIKTGVQSATNGTANNNDWQQIVALTLQNAAAGLANLGSFGGSSLSISSGSGAADFEARILINGTQVAFSASQPVISGSVPQPTDFTSLFQGTHPTAAGNITFTLQMRRTSGTGTITATNARLEATIIAS